MDVQFDYRFEDLKDGLLTIDMFNAKDTVRVLKNNILYTIMMMYSMNGTVRKKRDRFIIYKLVNPAVNYAATCIATDVTIEQVDEILTVFEEGRDL